MGIYFGNTKIGVSFDDIYPIGSYAFGVKPALGVWTEVTGDRAVWIKNGTADGTLISQALPNITGQFGRNGGSGLQSERSGSGAFSHYIGNSTSWGPASDISGTYYMPYFDAHYSNNIYKDGANVQPNAYVMTVWKRTA